MALRARRTRTLLEAVSAGPLPAAEAVAITMKIAAALAEAHRAGILHRDVKAGNIMLTPSGEVKVLDFGLAKRVGTSGDVTKAELTREGMAVGTLSYMSPEQLLAQKVDERSDLFSLGVVLYEMLAGRRPFQGSSAIATADAILHSPPPPLTSASVPEQLKAAVHRLLEKLWNASTLEVSLDSVPTGADVSYRELGVGPSAWRILGQTPVTKVRVPKAYYLWRNEKPGFRAAYQIWPTWVLRGTGEMQVRLDDDASVPAKMMHVTAGTVELAIPGLDHLPAVTLGDYLIVWRGRRALPGLDGPARPGDVGAGSVPEG